MAPQTATTEYYRLYAREVLDIFESLPEYDESFVLVGFLGDLSVTFGGFKMPPPSQRERSQDQVQNELQGKLEGVAGFPMSAFPRPSLPGAGQGLPFQFVLVSDADYQKLDGRAGRWIGSGMDSGNFLLLRKSIDFARPRTTLVIDSDRARALGLRRRDAPVRAPRQCIGRDIFPVVVGDLSGPGGAVRKLA